MPLIFPFAVTCLIAFLRCSVLAGESSGRDKQQDYHGYIFPPQNCSGIPNIPELFGVAGLNSLVKVFVDGMEVGSAVASAPSSAEELALVEEFLRLQGSSAITGKIKLSTPGKPKERVYSRVVPAQGVHPCGVFRFHVPQTLTDGRHSVFVVIEDTKTGSSYWSNEIMFLIDTGPPVINIVKPLNGDVTNDQQVIVKTDPGCGVILQLNNEAFAGTADEDGFAYFSVDQSGSYFAHARGCDLSGNWSDSIAITFEFCKVIPKPLITSPVPGPVGSNTINIEGIAKANSIIDVYLNNLLTWTTYSDLEGAFSISPPDVLIDGNYSIHVIAKDPEGIASSSDSVLFLVDTTPPPPPFITFPLQGTIFTESPYVEGYTDAGAKVSIYLDGTLFGTTQADINGHFVYREFGIITNGWHSIYAVSEDIVGNRSEASLIVEFIVEQAVFIPNKKAK